MNSYQVVFDAEVYVTVEAETEAEAETLVLEVATWQDVIILHTVDVDCIAGECED